MTMKVITMTMIVTGAGAGAGAGTVVPAVRGAAPWA